MNNNSSEGFGLPVEYVELLSGYELADLIGPDDKLNSTVGQEIMSRLAEIAMVNTDGSNQSPVAPGSLLDGVGVLKNTVFTVNAAETEKPRSWRSNEPLDNVTLQKADIILGLAVASLLEVEAAYKPFSAEWNDPARVLDVAAEVEGYYDFLERDQPTLLSTVTALQGQLGEARNDINAQHCAVAIPVAGHQEYKNIYHTLSQFAGQDLPADQFEVVLGLNLPAPDISSGDLSDIERDGFLASEIGKTIAEIERFKADYPDFPVRYYAQGYEGSLPSIGRIRSDLCAVIGLDAKGRGITADQLIVSCDADVARLSPNYLSAMVKTFEATGADIVTAGLRWQAAEGLPDDAPVNQMLRYVTLLDDFGDRHHSILRTSDANTAIAMSTYFAAGGFNRYSDLAEMIDLCWRIRSLRSINQKEYEPVKVVEAKTEEAWLETNSRRLLRIMALGHSPDHAWNQDLLVFGSDDALRTEAAQAGQANQMAAERGYEWLCEMLPRYARGVPEAELRKELELAGAVIGFAGLHLEKIATPDSTKQHY